MKRKSIFTILALAIFIASATSISARTPQGTCPKCGYGMDIVQKTIKTSTYPSKCSHYPSGDDIFEIRVYKDTSSCKHCGYYYVSEEKTSIKMIRCEGHY